ncbi:unnamed protein product [Cladocopium goreaui]|uniref:Uncharacterized protein n=1 Tax=Cladocopium goreaui TaxID=2562237 RepID=A0A9P1GTL8_9DINO|nr:unnamed protein product [Cladocopium goreaui]
MLHEPRNGYMEKDVTSLLPNFFTDDWRDDWGGDRSWNPLEHLGAASMGRGAMDSAGPDPSQGSELSKHFEVLNKQEMGVTTSDTADISELFRGWEARPISCRD